MAFLTGGNIVAPISQYKTISISLPKTTTFPSAGFNSIVPMVGIIVEQNIDSPVDHLDEITSNQLLLPGRGLSPSTLSVMRFRAPPQP